MRLRGHAQRLHADPMILVKREAGDSAKRRDVLVLLADGLAQAIDFDVAGKFRQFLGVGDLALLRVQRLQQRRGETPRGPKAGSRGYVRERRDLYLRRPQILQLAAPRE